MENLNDLHPTNRKVTLSCRVLPEQKLMIASKAKTLGLTLAQYTESKVLQNDSLELEEKIREQYVEIKRLQKEQSESQKSQANFEERISSLQKEIETISNRNLTALKSENLQLKLSFSNEKELEDFKEKLKRLSRKYKLGNLQSILKLCVEYTVKNDMSFFFIEKVSGFFRKQTSHNHSSNPNKIN